MNYKSILIFAFFLVLVSCNDSKKKAGPVSNPAYKNGIEMEVKGFKVKEAYLIYNDSTRVSEKNEAELGEHVNLEIVLDSGWTKINGRIYPGVYQKVESSDGNHIFEKPDLLESLPDGVSAEDGWLVRVQAVINSVDKHYDYFKVSFRVWDKKGEGVITGSYKLHPIGFSH